MTVTNAAGPDPVVVDNAQDGVVRVLVSGVVDADVADVFATACEQALGGHPDRLELDLSEVNAVGAAGVAVIAWCLSLQPRLAGGVGVSVATAAGRRALLAATNRV